MHCLIVQCELLSYHLWDRSEKNKKEIREIKQSKEKENSIFSLKILCTTIQVADAWFFWQRFEIAMLLFQQAHFVPSLPIFIGWHWGRNFCSMCCGCLKWYSRLYTSIWFKFLWIFNRRVQIQRILFTRQQMQRGCVLPPFFCMKGAQGSGVDPGWLWLATSQSGGSTDMPN